MDMSGFDPRKLAAMEEEGGGFVGAGYLALYVIYDHPRDFPNHWVVRQHLVNGAWTSVAGIGIVCNSLEEARESVPPGLFRMIRSDGDDPVIVETWI